MKSACGGKIVRGEMMRRYGWSGGKKGPYFEGWYLKCQTREGEALALIPAFHIDGEERRSASLQVLADGGSWWLEYPAGEFQASEAPFQVRVGQNIFSDSGVWLCIRREGLSLHGVLRSGAFWPLHSDIMGPFRFLPGMECVHGVLSMGHSLEGTLTLNGRRMDFAGGTGYVETDRGRSFPSAYLWAQCAWGGPAASGLMLAVAAVPMGPVGFTGCICAVRYEGREYRLATYCGARVEGWDAGGAVIRQGKYRLAAELLEGRGRPLRAPAQGVMGRTIHESLRSSMRFRLWQGERLLLDHTDSWASFEYAAE